MTHMAEADTEAAPHTWRRTFPATRAQAHGARLYLAGILNGSSLTGDAVACLGELTNNAVFHSNSRRAGGTFTVHVKTRQGRLRVEVHDQGGPWAPSPALGPSSVLDTSGRGLLIVAALADQWGITPTGPAAKRTAWFEMKLP